MDAYIFVRVAEDGGCAAVFIEAENEAFAESLLPPAEHEDWRPLEPTDGPGYEVHRLHFWTGRKQPMEDS